VFRLEKHGYVPLGTQLGLVKVGQDKLTKGLGYVLSAYTFHTLSDVLSNTVSIVLRSQNP
jgi:hypothetical protein